MKEFYTRERANAGVEIALQYPDGTPSPHKLRIRSTDSDAFRAAEAEHRQQLLDIADDDPARKVTLVAHSRIKLLASLIVNWTFEEPLTPENAETFLREAPQVADLVDRKAAQRALFYPPASPSSDALPGPSLSSTQTSQAAAPQGAST